MSLPILSLVTFVPLLGAAAILALPRPDAARWIAIPIVGSFQPSDFAGLALIVNLASMLAKRQQRQRNVKNACQRNKCPADEKERLITYAGIFVNEHFFGW